MLDEDFMKLAVKQAKRSAAAGGIAVGAIIVKNEKVLTGEISAVWPDKDPSAHAEILCMKRACQQLGEVNLVGCTIFTTLEPCSMCLGCAGWSSLSKIVFGAYLEDIPGNPYEMVNYHAIDHANNISSVPDGFKIDIIGGVLREECKQLMVGMVNWSNSPV